MIENNSENTKIYDRVSKTPKHALKEISGGRLSGMSSINPMWRIKTLTEVFGACGIGWKPVIDDQWIEAGGNDEKKAFVKISLYIRQDGAWSDAIPGYGGASFVAKEKSGLYTDDEAFKKAFTDALGSACKLLGFSSDIYFSADPDSKYRSAEEEQDAFKKM